MHEEQVDVAADAGLVYAKLTGDWNPHHLYPWSARLLRYERPIAHGMWTLSRAIAHVQSSKTFSHIVTIQRLLRASLRTRSE